jgi:hypothetical protein
MTKTTQQLAERVLQRLKIVAAGETPDAADAQTVKTFYAGQFAEMGIDDLTYWDEADIPDEAFEALADFLAGRLAPDFGLSRPDLEASGERRLRRLAARGPTYRVVAGEYF